MLNVVVTHVDVLYLRQHRMYVIGEGHEINIMTPCEAMRH